MNNSNTLEKEISHLQSEIDRLRKERDAYRDELERTKEDLKNQVSTELQILSPKLADEIKTSILSQFKLYLGIVALAGTIATIGGAWKLSDIIDDIIKARIQENENVFASLRESTIKTLAESRVTIEVIRNQSNDLERTVSSMQQEYSNLETDAKNLKDLFGSLTKSEPVTLAEKIKQINQLTENSKQAVDLRIAFDQLENETRRRSREAVVYVENYRDGYERTVIHIHKIEFQIRSMQNQIDSIAIKIDGMSKRISLAK